MYNNSSIKEENTVERPLDHLLGKTNKDGVLNTQQLAFSPLGGLSIWPYVNSVPLRIILLLHKTRKVSRVSQNIWVYLFI